MKHILLTLVLGLLAFSPGSEVPRPRPADFIPAGVRSTFGEASNPKYWGPDTGGWHLGLTPVAEPWVYVEQGGQGEALELYLTAFTSKADPHRWESPKPLRVTFKIAAEKLPDFFFSESLEPVGMTGAGDAAAWSFWVSVRRLQQMELHWGRLPSKISVSAVLDDARVPEVSTAAMPVLLRAVANRDATWSQFLKTLKVGQSREDVEALLGRPVSERRVRRADGTSFVRLVYPNPDASADLPIEMRVSHVLLDGQGRFLFYSFYGGC